MELHEFFEGARNRQKNFPNERKGQAAFNLLYEVRKELADEIRGTDNDPFYDDSNWGRFVSFLSVNLEE